MNRGFISALLAIIIVVVIAGIGYWLWSHKSAVTVQNPPVSAVSTSSVAITSKNDFYIGVDNPIVFSGTASGIVSVKISFLEGDQSGTFILASSTIPVTDGKWTYTLPQSVWWRQASTGFYGPMVSGGEVAIFSADATDLIPSDSNRPLTSQGVTIYPAITIFTTDGSTLSGQTVPASGVTSMDVVIYKLNWSGNQPSLGPVVFSANNVPVGHTVNAIDHEYDWSIPIQPPLQDVHTQTYEIYVYLPSDHTIPLYQGS